MSRHISNRFVIVSNIQIIIRMLYYSFEKLFLLGLFYLIVKSGKSLVIIGSRFQVALFFWFYRNFQPLTSLIPTLPLSYPSAYLVLPNVTTPPLTTTPCLFGPKSTWFRDRKTIAFCRYLILQFGEYTTFYSYLISRFQ